VLERNPNAWQGPAGKGGDICPYFFTFPAELKSIKISFKKPVPVPAYSQNK